MQNWSLSGGLFVALLYWVLLRGSIQPQTILAHGGIWFVIVIDCLWIGKQSIRLVHGVWVILLGWIYGLWTVIFFSAGLLNKEGQPWIYAPIQWGTAPGMAFFWAFCSPVVVLFPMHALFWGLFQIKNRFGAGRPTTAVTDNTVMVMQDKKEIGDDDLL